jgi:hypothetical protein
LAQLIWDEVRLLVRSLDRVLTNLKRLARSVRGGGRHRTLRRSAESLAQSPQAESRTLRYDADDNTSRLCMNYLDSVAAGLEACGLRAQVLSQLG